MKKSWPAIVGAVAVALGVAACGSGANDVNPNEDAATSEEVAEPSPNVTLAPPGEPRTGGSLAYGLDAESQGFNPAANTFAPATLVVATAVFDPLMSITADGELEPYLAESLVPNDDFTSWTLTVRPGISFHNGEPLDAEAVVGLLEAVRSSPIVGTAAKPIREVTAVDELTVRIDLSLAWAAFPWLLTGQVGFVPAPAMLADPQGSRQPIGTGPFVFDSWTPDSSLKVGRNPDYWREGLPYLDAVEFRPLPDTSSRMAALSAGDIHMIHAVEPALVNRLKAEAGRPHQLVTSTGESLEVFVLLNTERIPDVRVRQAMAHAIDRDALLTTLGIDLADAADSPFERDSTWWADSSHPGYDAERASALVAEVEAESGPVTVTLGALPTPESSQIAQLIGENWKAAGIEVSLASLEQSTYIVNTVQGNFEATLFRQFGGPDPDTDSVFWHSDQATGPITINMARNQDAELDEALFVGRTSPDREVRRQAYATVQQRFAATLPYLWLFHADWVVAYDVNTFGVLDGTLPDGSPAMPVVNGANRLTEVWRA